MAITRPTVRLAAERFGAERSNLTFGWIFAAHQLGAATAAFGLWREEWRTIDYPEMAHRLDAHPEIVGINAHIGQKDLKES